MQPRAASPDPATARAAPACGPGQLALTVEDAGGAAGTAFDAVRLSLVHGPPCAVSGTPTVSFNDRGRPVQVHEADDDGVHGGFGWTGPVLVAPGTPAEADWAYTNALCDYSKTQPTADLTPFGRPADSP